MTPRLLTVAVGVFQSLVLVGALSACAAGPHPEPRTVVEKVATPVAVSCVPPSLPSEPSYPDTDEALRSADAERSLNLVLTGRDQRQARLLEVEPVIKGCRAPAP
jgi:hypothetical protein